MKRFPETLQMDSTVLHNLLRRGSELTSGVNQFAWFQFFNFALFYRRFEQKNGSKKIKIQFLIKLYINKKEMARARSRKASAWNKAVSKAFRQGAKNMTQASKMAKKTYKPKASPKRRTAKRRSMRR
jgi:hypothetical protein